MAPPRTPTTSGGERSEAQMLAQRLGWLSVGLGLLPLLAPDRLARIVGIDDGGNRPLLRAVGARELAVAAGLLAGGAPQPWLWARVAQDAMDVPAAALAASRRRGPRRTRMLTTLAALGGVTAVDVLAALRASRDGGATGEPEPTRLTAATTVLRPADELYDRWRNLERLPDFMQHLQAVRVTAPDRSQWTARAPFGRTVEWEAEIVRDEPGRLLSWRSLPGSQVTTSGSVRFSPAPGDRGTEVSVEMEYTVPGGALGEKVAGVLGEDPYRQVADDLRRFKQVAETGEVVRSDGSPAGTDAHAERRQRPAQPRGASAT